MQTAKLFMNGRSQAVRLPKAFAFEGDEVIIKRYGDGVLLMPKKNAWQTMFDAVQQFEGTIEREPQGEQERTDFLNENAP